jgi:hypothetical protein
MIGVISLDSSTEQKEVNSSPPGKGSFLIIPLILTMVINLVGLSRPEHAKTLLPKFQKYVGIQ